MEQYSIAYIQHLLPLVSLIGLDPNIDPRTTINPDYTSLKREVTLKILETWGVNEGSALWHLSAIPNIATNLTNNSPILTNAKEVFFNKEGVSIKKGTLNLFKVITQPKVILNTKRTGPSGVGNPSPLSPNNQASPLYPDGIITPLWCKKHQFESPAVIVMFFDLWKFDSGNNSNSEENKLHHILNQNSVQNTVREKDSALAQTISDYRKLMNERGIKLIAVFWNLNNQDDLVEDRLLHIRRTSGLDPKTGFFILDDEASKRLPEFIHGIQKSMAESCMNYYRERYKIVKKKYTRLNHLSSPLPDNALPLLGWAARYEFKLGTFAAFRQDFELAVKHYESCYFSLIEMLIKLELNLNRRERWKETLDFMDCLSLNINRLMLYLESPQLSLIQLKRHLFYGKSLRLSKTSGLGLPEHEYSKWEFSQYFAFAELLDCGIKFGVKYNPTNLNTNSQNQHKSIAMTSNLLLHGSPVKNRMGDTKITHHSGSSFQFSSEATNVSPNSSAIFQYDDINPISIVQHPGYYYYQAAECLINQTYQKKSFVKDQDNQISESKEEELEQSEDHQSNETAQIIEVLSKSYEQFKKYRGHRMTLLVASKIAETYLNSEKYDLASKFYERIAKSYRKESWPQLLQMILLNGVKCAQYLENSSEWFLLNSFELLSPSFTLIEDQHNSIIKGIQDKLNEPLSNTSTELSNQIPKNVVIEIENPKTSFIYFYATFEPNPIDTHLGVKLQLQVQVHSSSTDESFNLSFIKVSFKDSSLDFQFQHDDLASINVMESNINGEGVKYIQHAYEYQNNDQNSQEENILRLIPSNLELNWKGCTKVLETIILPYDAEFLEITSIHGSISNANYQIIFKQKLPDNQLSSFIKPIGLNDQTQNTQLDMPSYPSPLQQFDSNSSKWLSFIEENKKLKWTKLKESDSSHSIKIRKPTSLLKIEFEPPTQNYLDEPNNSKITVKNDHSDSINVELYISISNPNSDDKLLEIEGGEIISKDLIKFTIDSIAQNESIDQEFRYIFRKFEGERQLAATVIYHKINARSTTIKYQVEKTYTFNTFNPFKAQFQFLPQFGIKNNEEPEFKDNSVDSIIEAIAPNLSISKEYLMLINLNGPDKIETEIESIKWVEENVYNNEDKYTWKLIESSLKSAKQVLKPNSPLSIQNLIKLKLQHSSLSSKNQIASNLNFEGWCIDWKPLTIIWKRLNSPDSELNYTEISIPSLLIHDHKIEVNIDLPNQVYQNQPFSIKYEIQNHTELTQELSASFDFNNIPLVFSGYKVQTFMCLPYSKTSLKITCHPLTYGRIFLPQLILEEAKTSNQGSGSHLDLQVDRDINWGWDYNTTYLMVIPDHSL